MSEEMPDRIWVRSGKVAYTGLGARVYYGPVKPLHTTEYHRIPPGKVLVETALLEQVRGLLREVEFVRGRHSTDGTLTLKVKVPSTWLEQKAWTLAALDEMEEES